MYEAVSSQRTDATPPWYRCRCPLFLLLLLLLLRCANVTWVVMPTSLCSWRWRLMTSLIRWISVGRCDADRARSPLADPSIYAVSRWAELDIRSRPTVSSRGFSARGIEMPPLAALQFFFLLNVKSVDMLRKDLTVTARCYAQARYTSWCLSVCHTVYCMETAEDIIRLFFSAW